MSTHLEIVIWKLKEPRGFSLMVLGIVQRCSVCQSVMGMVGERINWG
jgi:hypothetical protein